MKERETVDAIYQQIITLIQLYSVNKQVKGGLDLCISTLLLHHSKCPWTFLFLSPYQLPPKKAKIKTKMVPSIGDSWIPSAGKWTLQSSWREC